MHREGVPHRASPRAPREVHRVVRGVPLDLALVVLHVQHVEVARVLGVRRAREAGLAVEERAAVERREQPLVRVHDERVGVAQPGEQVRGACGRASPRRRRRRPRGTRCRAPSRSGPTPSSSSTMPALVVPAVATTATMDSGCSSASSARRSAVGGEDVVPRRDDEGVHPEQVQRGSDRGVRLLADRAAQVAGILTGMAAPTVVTGDGERGEVAERAAGDEGPTRRRGHARTLGEEREQLVLRDDDARGLHVARPVER